MAKLKAIAYSEDSTLTLPERVGGSGSGEATTPVVKPGTGNTTASTGGAGKAISPVAYDYGAGTLDKTTQTPTVKQTTEQSAAGQNNQTTEQSAAGQNNQTTQPVTQQTTQQVTLPEATLPEATLPEATVTAPTSGASAGYTLPSAPSVDTSTLQSLLAAWQTAANQQTQTQVDYATNQAIAELQRAEEDAQADFKEQAESVALDERQGMDNSALYAETRGDKGGIGQAQYNQIQAAAAQNRLAVQQAQTKLSTDTVRQIADLRAQGEFEKADAMLETAQTYLSQLVQLEQWAAEYGLSAAQFQASMEQWAAEFDMAMQQYQTSVDQWNQEFQYQQSRDAVADSQWAQELAVTQSQKIKTQQAAMGEALLNAGIMPSAEQLAAMGITETQAQQWVIAAQLAAAQEEDETVPTFTTTDALYQALMEENKTTKASAAAQMDLWGYDSDKYLNDYLTWLSGQGETGEEVGTSTTAQTSLSSADGSMVYVPGYGMVTWTRANELLTLGKISILGHDENGDPIFAQSASTAIQNGSIIPSALGFTGGN